jgi:hypothetical protein
MVRLEVACVSGDDMCKPHGEIHGEIDGEY